MTILENIIEFIHNLGIVFLIITKIILIIKHTLRRCIFYEHQCEFDIFIEFITEISLIILISILLTSVSDIDKIKSELKEIKSKSINVEQNSNRG